MELNLKGKKAIITGAGRGIGKSIAIDLSKEGVEIFGISRTKKNLLSMEKSLYGKNHHIYAINLMKVNSITNIIEKLKNSGFDPDIIINNVGDHLDIKNPLCNMKDWRDIFRINLEIAVELNRALIPMMQKKKWGRIINISSTAGMENTGPVPYCAAKAALTAYTRSMGRIYAKDNIVMIAIMPGVIFTEDGFWSKCSEEYKKKSISEKIPYGKAGDPSDISKIVTFLCSDYAKFFHGSIIPVDGGQSRNYFNYGQI